MKKKILSVFLSFCLIISCFVGFSVTAGAEVIEITQSWIDNNTLLPGGTYVLKENVTLNHALGFSGNCTIDLNGKSITTGNLYITNNMPNIGLTISSSEPGGAIIGNNGIVDAKNGLNVTINSGTVSNIALWHGSICNVNGGTVTALGIYSGDNTINTVNLTGGIIRIFKTWLATRLSIRPAVP